MYAHMHCPKLVIYISVSKIVLKNSVNPIFFSIVYIESSNYI